MNALDENQESFLAIAREEMGLSTEEQAQHMAAFGARLKSGVWPPLVESPAFEAPSTDSKFAGPTDNVSSSSSLSSALGQLNPLLLLGSGVAIGCALGFFGADQLQEPDMAQRELSAPRDESLEVSVPTLVEQVDVAPVAKETRQPLEKSLAREEPQRSPVLKKKTRATEAKVSARKSSPEPTFYEELSYLRRAQAALREGQPAMALGLMESLDQLQKVGALGLERRVTKALALCALERSAEAQAVASPVFNNQSNSVYARRLSETCARPVSADTGSEEKELP